MLRRRFLTCLAAGAAAVIVSGSIAEEKKPDALAGTWAMQGAEMKIEFAEKGVLKLFPHGDGDVIVFVCKYTLEKGGLVKAKIAELEGTKKDIAKDKFPEGTEFSFKWTVKDNVATLDDVKGDKFEAFKSHLEGKYDRK
jgi:hypothetical protein